MNTVKRCCSNTDLNNWIIDTAKTIMETMLSELNTTIQTLPQRECQYVSWAKTFKKEVEYVSEENVFLIEFILTCNPEFKLSYSGHHCYAGRAVRNVAELLRYTGDSNVNHWNFESIMGAWTARTTAKQIIN